MNRLLVICLGLLVLASACKNRIADLPTRLKAADHVLLEYYGDDYAANNPVVIRSLSQLATLSNFVTEKEVGELKCKQDGRIKFQLRDSVVFEAEFSLGEDCARASWMEGETYTAFILQPEALELLRTTRDANRVSSLDQLAWFKGRWMQVEGPDLVSYEEWDRVSSSKYVGRSWTMFQMDTVHVETIDLVLEGTEIYYIPTVKENAGPVRFKLTKLAGKTVEFENPEHDFPQKISYEAKGDTMLLAIISGARNGQVAQKEFPLQRVQE